MTLKASYTTGAADVDFTARNAAGQWWNGAAFETYNAANLATYRITATETPAGSGIYHGTEPSGATEYELRYRGATLALSVVVAGPVETGAASATAIRDSVGLESANLALLVNAIAGKNVWTNNGDGTYDCDVRNTADSASLGRFRFTPATGNKVVL